MRHGFESDERAAFVQRRVDEQVRRFVPRVELSIVQPPGKDDAGT